LPASVVFVGGGVIALEFSHVYARAGSKVTILDVLPRLLGNMDADAVAQLRAATRAARHRDPNRSRRLAHRAIRSPASRGL
jgi:pyruvate/2-oxoglutarate dehydrogenase complex dihydrolipoamide dehydrogenase (E3) component